jgi:nitroreductase
MFMNFTQLLKNRRSIRTYLKKEVEEEKIKKILAMVNLAPSAGNLQAYKIFVIRDKKIIEEITKNAPGLSYFENLPPLLFVFCANQKESESRYGKRGFLLYAIQDATIACTYAQLAACDLGLGSCWIGAFDEEKIKEILKTNLLPVAILTVGYPDENPPRRGRKKIEEIAKFL